MSQRILHLSRIVSSPLLFSLIFIFSCNGQESVNGSNGEMVDSATSHIEPTYERLFPTDPDHFDRLFQIEGQLCQHLRTIIEDEYGNLWFGTNIYGVIKFDGDTLIYFDNDQGFDGGRITGSLLDDDGHPWFSAHGGLYKYNGKTFDNYDERHGAADAELFGLIEANDGSFWTGSMVGVSRFDDLTFTNLSLPKIAVEDTTSILSYDRVSSVFQDSQGVFWFGTDGFGICIYNPTATPGSKEEFRHLTMANGLPDNNISGVFEDKKGYMWISTMYGGMCRYDGKAFTNFGALGLVEGVEAGDIYEDSAGNLWFPVEHQGVYRYDGETFTNFGKEDGLETGGVICIYEDSKERFWLGGWMGLFRYDPTTAHERGGKAFYAVTVDGPWVP